MSRCVICDEPLGLPHSEDHRSVMWPGGNGLASHIGSMDVVAVKLNLQKS